MQYITRKGSFDSAHRVMNEKMKCFHLHGHTYLYELTFSFGTMEEIGYPIDFKEIKRVGCQWIDDILDHGAILNPKDETIIQACTDLQTKMWLMSLSGFEYCNPTVENIAREIFLAMDMLFELQKHVEIHRVRLWETPNCFTDCYSSSIPNQERLNFMHHRYDQIMIYAQDKGMITYDNRQQ